MKGCLQIVGGAVVLVVIVVACAGIFGNYASSSTSSATTRASVDRHDATAEATATPYVDYCGKATSYERKAMSDVDASNYRAAYDLAKKGLSANANCANDDDQIVNEGYLLSAKGYAEHFLPEGDSRTDMNQANQLLVECQTRPGLYGTHVAAQCESQEQNNISATTDWEMNE